MASTENSSWVNRVGWTHSGTQLVYLQNGVTRGCSNWGLWEAWATGLDAVFDSISLGPFSGCWSFIALNMKAGRYLPHFRTGPPKDRPLDPHSFPAGWPIGTCRNTCTLPCAALSTMDRRCWSGSSEMYGAMVGLWAVGKPAFPPEMVRSFHQMAVRVGLSVWTCWSGSAWCKERAECSGDVAE